MNGAAQTRPLVRRFSRLLPAMQREDQLMLVLSLVVGAIAGLTVVAFVLVTGRLAARLFPADSSALRRLLVPTLSSLLTGFLLYKYLPESRGSGIPQTKVAIFLKDGFISMRTIWGKFLCCSITLASGIALGREGPSVQIGAGIGSVIGRKFGLGPDRVRILVPVGCSAALAAAFNTPVAAVLFSLEEIIGDLQAPVLVYLLLGSAASWLMLRLVAGDQPLFHVPAYQLANPLEFGIYAIVGVVGGLASVGYVKLLLWIRLWFKTFPPASLWLQPVAGGLLMGAMGWFVPQVLGVGYDLVDRVLGGDLPIRMAALLALLRIVATPASYSSGNSGGLFGPTVFFGAMVGGAAGGTAHALFPAITGNPGAYALIGMGTAFAGILRTPFTSVIMVFEMTRDYNIIVPLMIANMISFAISKQLQKRPLYDALSWQDGIVLPTPESRAETEGAPVSTVARKGEPALDPECGLADALKALDSYGTSSWPVGREGRVEWVASRRAIDAGLGAVSRLCDLAASVTAFPSVYPDHPLGHVLERMREAGMDALPVVSRADVHELVGIVTRQEILGAYGVGGNHQA